MKTRWKEARAFLDLEIKKHEKMVKDCGGEPAEVVILYTLEQLRNILFGLPRKKKTQEKEQTLDEMTRKEPSE